MFFYLQLKENGQLHHIILIDKVQNPLRSVCFVLRWICNSSLFISNLVIFFLTSDFYVYLSCLLCYVSLVPQDFKSSGALLLRALHMLRSGEAQPITVDLTDANGKVVRVLYEDLAKKGENRITISTQNLAIGIYFVRVYSDNKSILVKKLVRQ